MQRLFLTYYVKLKKSFQVSSVSRIKSNKTNNNRKPIKFSHNELLIISKTDSIDERMKRLNENYFQNCYLYKNEMVMEAINKYLNWYSDNKDSTFKTILCNYRDKIKTFK